MKKILLAGFAAALALACQRNDTDTTQTTSATVTPVDQSNARADLDTTASIRKALVADHDLSMNAKNVKIISRDGNVTLRGMVDNEAEKVRIQDEAARVAGVRNVDNELEVRW